jgi:hypothetical protein
MDSISKCMKSSDVSSEIVNTFLDSMGIKVVDSTQTQMSGSTSSNVTQEATSHGPLDAIGDLFSNLFKGIFTGLGIGIAGPIIVVVVSCCCCLILLGIIFGIFTLF